MSTVLPFPTNPVRHPRIGQPTARRVGLRFAAATPGHGATDRIAECLIALEAACYFEPCVALHKGRIALTTVGYDRLLNPAEARLVAYGLRTDNAFIGADAVARALEQAADQAEQPRPQPAPHGSGRRFLIIALIAAAAVVALRAFA